MPRVPHIVELSAAPDPWVAAQRLSGLPHVLLLESVDRAVPGPLNRWSFLAADPIRWIVAQSAAGDANPLDEVRRIIDENRYAATPDLPPFPGGVAGLFGYGMAQWTENLPRPPVDEFGLPDVAVGVYDWAINWDHRTGRCQLVAATADRVAAVKRWLEHGVPVAQSPMSTTAGPNGYQLGGHPRVVSNFDRAGFEAAVARAVEYTHAGDCFQVNIAQQLSCPFPMARALELYDRSRAVNPAPFAGYFDAGQFSIVSASPERFLCCDPNGHVTTRPIKGTRPRCTDPRLDAASAEALLASAKDRAENVMIVDLMRNDLGRVCEYGSVHVSQLCALESYPTVHHLVSEVTGRLRPDCSAVDLLRVAMPGGSVTGAPKVRAMQIITELEGMVRGPYCGSLGYLGFDGSMDTNIMIRSFTLANGRAVFPVGAGIVADSEPAREYEETLDKARGLLAAIREFHD